MSEVQKGGLADGGITEKVSEKGLANQSRNVVLGFQAETTALEHFNEAGNILGVDGAATRDIFVLETPNGGEISLRDHGNGIASARRARRVDLAPPTPYSNATSGEFAPYHCPITDDQNGPLFRVAIRNTPGTPESDTPHGGAPCCGAQRRMACRLLAKRPMTIRAVGQPPYCDISHMASRHVATHAVWPNPL